MQKLKHTTRKTKKAYVFPYGHNGFVQGVIEYETYLGFVNYQSTFMLDMYKFNTSRGIIS